MSENRMTAMKWLTGAILAIALLAIWEIGVRRLNVSWLASSQATAQPVLQLAPQGERMSFCKAQQELAVGSRVAREAWYAEGDGMWVVLVRGDPALRLTCDGGAVVPLLLSEADVMTGDWFVVSP